MACSRVDEPQGRALDADLPEDSPADTHAERDTLLEDSSADIADLGRTAPDPTATPTFDPAPGVYDRPITVTIKSATPGAAIYYTTDGTEPTVASTKYVGPLNVTKTTAILARALAPGLDPSDRAAATYSLFARDGIAPVTFDPPSGSYAGDVLVELRTEAPGATICYTVDEAQPTCDEASATCGVESAKYTSPVKVTPTTSGMTVRALACKVTMYNSTVTSATYKLP